MNKAKPPQPPAMTPEPPRGPMVPRPVVTVIALAVTGLMMWHIYFDATHEPYDGGKVTILLGAIVFFTLGFDVSKWFRGGGS